MSTANERRQFEPPRILTESELNTIRGKALVGHATPSELMAAFSHFDLVLDELRKLRGCFPDKIYIFGAYGDQWSADERDQDIEYDEVDLKALLGD
jgi:hypothetical protein